MARKSTALERADTAIVEELLAVLAPHPAGLRRWSVMNAIRQRRRASARDIPLKMEADIERTFRQFCAGDALRMPDGPLFYRPSDKAGEVWAIAVPAPVLAGATANIDQTGN